MKDLKREAKWLSRGTRQVHMVMLSNRPIVFSLESSAISSMAGALGFGGGRAVPRELLR